MPPLLLKGILTPLRLNEHEGHNQGNCCIWDAGSRHVCQQIFNGGSAEHPFAGDVHHCLYGCLPEKGLVPNLCVCAFKWGIQRVFQLVGAIPLPVDGALGHCYAAAPEYAKKGTANCIYGRMRWAWVSVWDTVCPGAGIIVWPESGRDGGMDFGRAALGFCTWGQ